MGVITAGTGFLVLLCVSFVAISRGAACIPSQPYVDCNFHTLSFPNWATILGNMTALTSAWKAAVAQIPEYPSGRFVGQGLVITATKLDLVNVPVLLKKLQLEGFALPVEIWFSGEVNSEMISFLMTSYDKLVIKNVANYASDRDLQSTATSQGEHVFQVKPLAILHSAFEDVLFLDADNIPLANPSYLFSVPEYLSSGALFWPDFWRTAIDNPIWQILGLSPQGWEQESGQIVVNKQRTWAALHLAFFLAKDRMFQQLVNGDKEAFRLAFLALEVSFFMVETPVAVAGVTSDAGTFCGHTMVQHDPRGLPLFLHHNSLKHGPEISWEVMKSAQTGSSYAVVPLPPASINNEPVACLDMEGLDVVTTPHPFATFEKSINQLQSLTNPTLKAASRDEFFSILEVTRRRILQDNETIPAPTAPGGGIDYVNGCPEGRTQCVSRYQVTAVCCIDGCSGIYQDSNIYVDSPQYCKSATGGVDVPTPPTPAPGSTSPPVTIPSPTVADGSIDYTKSCGAGYVRCVSRYQVTAVCCIDGCSGFYQDSNIYVDSPQYCKSAIGGVDMPTPPTPAPGSTPPPATVPSPTAAGGDIDYTKSCGAGYVRCISRYQVSALCCSNGCSGVYEDPNQYVDSPQYCKSATGGVDVPVPAAGSTPLPATVPSPTLAGGGIDFTKSCDAGYVRCTSRFVLSAVCCSAFNGGCSGIYANNDPTVESPQLCAAGL